MNCWPRSSGWLAEATPGPWRTEPDPGWECDECGERDEQAAIVRAPSGGGICVVLTDARDDANASLIAYYRTAAPLLAAEIERLRGEVAALKHDQAWTVPAAAFVKAIARGWYDSAGAMHDERNWAGGDEVMLKGHAATAIANAIEALGPDAAKGAER